MACLFGHKWNGCKCDKCGKIRQSDHQWEKGKCKICGEVKEIKLTVGTCCVCGKPLERAPSRAVNSDDMARFCVNCGTDICVYCLSEQPKEGQFDSKCPVCGKTVIFEINPMCRPK